MNSSRDEENPTSVAPPKYYKPARPTRRHAETKRTNETTIRSESRTQSSSQVPSGTAHRKSPRQARVRPPPIPDPRGPALSKWGRPRAEPGDAPYRARSGRGRGPAQPRSRDPRASCESRRTIGSARDEHSQEDRFPARPEPGTGRRMLPPDSVPSLRYSLRSEADWYIRERSSAS
jgi:hypothetical protein